MKISYQLTEEEKRILDLLMTEELNNKFSFNYPRSKVFFQKKVAFFPLIFPQINLFLKELNIFHKEDYLHYFWYFWFPLALDLMELKQSKSDTLIMGILGSQGTGKSTLTTILTQIWQCLGLNSIELSLDDLYKTYQERQELLKIDSRLRWRGVPLTHDVSLGLEILDRVKKQDYPIFLPRFDKSLHNGMGDRTTPKTANQADIMIFEGWFVGVQPVAENPFFHAPYPIVTEEDKQFALDNNQRLKEYLPLWEKLDYLLILNPEDYRYSLQWRKEAEHKMIQTGKTGMTDKQIEEFVYYFWKALHPQIYLPHLLKTADLVVNLNINHSVKSIFQTHPHNE